jgi:multicomponent Na+:H+ antiporter subunit G
LSDFIAAASLLIGASFMLVASMGLVRFPDIYTRMHAATKATTFGMGGILLATALAFGSADIAAQSGLALFFLFLTAPVSAHLISRAAYRSGPHLAPNTTVDDYKPYLAEQAAAEEKEAAEDKGGPEESGPAHPSAGKVP